MGQSVGQPRRIELPRLKPRFHKLLIRWLLYWVGVFILRAAAELPRGLANFLVSRIALIGYYIFKGNRNIALDNLRVAFREKYSRKQRRAIANRMFLNFGRSLAEFVTLPWWGRRRIVQVVDGQKYLRMIEQGLRKGRGVIIAGGHIGNWEVFAAYTAAHYPLSVVARRLYFAPFDRAVVERRKKLGMHVIYQQDGVRPILRALRQNRVLGLMVDQDIKGVASDFVDFFGRKASTPNAHAAIALTTGAVMYAAALVRKPDLRHFEILIEGPVEIKRTGDKTADRIALVQKWSRLFEWFIEQHPDQWAWFHPRWKTRPPEEN
jgi:KDO2-lipid IV(A) lauroyltransferase